MRKTDFEHFVEQYLPQLDREGALRRYETYGKDLEAVRKYGGENCEYLWTMVEAEDKWYILRGYHLVNRLFYIISQNPWNEKTRDYKYM